MMKLKTLVFVIFSTACLKLISAADYCLSSVSCRNGVCDTKGVCVCNSCWQGEDCSLYVDNYPPKFSEHWRHVKLNSSVRGAIFQISAHDEDLAMTCHFRVECPCADINYVILDGNDDQIFILDDKSGVVFLAQWAELYPGFNHRLEFGAFSTNYTSSEKNKLVVDIFVDDGFSDADYYITRNKRQIIADDALVSIKQIPTGSTSEIKFGCGATFQVEIILSERPVNLKLHLSTVNPETEESTLRLCDVSVRKSGIGIKSQMEINQMTGKYIKHTREDWNNGIDFDFGSISGDQSSSIVIKFKVVLINSKLAVDGSLHPVIVQTDTDGNKRQWTKQLTAKINKDYDSTFNNAFFSLDGPEVAERDTRISFILKTFIYFPAEELQFVTFVFGDELRELSMESFSLVDKGSNFICLDEDSITLRVTDEDPRFLSKLDMGVVHNCGIEENINANKLIFEFILKVKDIDEKNLSNNVTLSFGAKIGGKNIWTGLRHLVILPKIKEKHFVQVSISNDSTTIYNDGNEATLKLTLKCDRQLDLVVLRVFLPPFLNYISHISNVSGVRKSDKSYLEFEVKNTVKGISQIIFTLKVNLKGRKEQRFPEIIYYLPVQVVCEFNSQFYFCANVEPALIKITSTELTCTNSKPLKLDPCQLSASSAIDENVSPQQNRFWSPAFRLGNTHNFYQVNLGNLTLVTSLNISSGSAKSQPIRKYQLMTSIDGRSWTSVGNEVNNLRGSSNISALTRFLRIVVVEPKINVMDDEEIGAKFHFAGCAFTQDFTIEATCNYSPRSRISTDVTNYRHYSIDEERNIFYFCDVVQLKKYLLCFCSLDKGDTWKSLPDYMAYLKGYNAELKMMVAMDKSGLALIKSENCLQWMPAREEEAESLKLSIPVPGVKANELSNLTPFDKWTVDFHGVRFDGALKLDWRTTCA